MTEPIHPPPEMFTATRYMVFTTFWAFVLPGAIIHGLPLLLTGIFSLDPIALGGVAVCVVFLYGGIRFLKRLSDCHRTGNGPRSFIVRILPFWIPLFWGLTMSAIGFFVGPLSLLAFQGCMLGSFPHFFIPFAFCLIIGGALFMVIAGSTINFLLAIIGTIYISLLAPPIPKKRSLVLCIAITLLLCWLAGLSYHHFRTKMLPPFSAQKNTQHESARSEVDRLVSLAARTGTHRKRRLCADGIGHCPHLFFQYRNNAMTPTAILKAINA